MEVVDAMHTKLHPYQGIGGLHGSGGEPAYVAVPTAMAPYPEFSEVVPAQPIWTSQNEQTAKPYLAPSASPAVTPPPNHGMLVKHYNLARLVDPGRGHVTRHYNAPLLPKKARRDSKRLEASQEDTRWWTRSGQSLECPLTGFPIRLLPYPPFKLRVDPQKPSPQILVDGKLLAMQLIADGHATHGLRPLENSDIQALDSYIQRCKLGPWRPGIAQSLAKEMVSATSEAQRHRAASELQKNAFEDTKRIEKTLSDPGQSFGTDAA